MLRPASGVVRPLPGVVRPAPVGVARETPTGLPMDVKRVPIFVDTTVDCDCDTLACNAAGGADGVVADSVTPAATPAQEKSVCVPPLPVMMMAKSTAPVVGIV